MKIYFSRIIVSLRSNLYCWYYVRLVYLTIKNFYWTINRSSKDKYPISFSLFSYLINWYKINQFCIKININEKMINLKKWENLKCGECREKLFYKIRITTSSFFIILHIHKLLQNNKCSGFFKYLQQKQRHVPTYIYRSCDRWLIQ